MNIQWQGVLAIVKKDILDMSQSKYLLFSLFLVPLLFGVLFPVIYFSPYLSGGFPSSSNQSSINFPLTSNWSQLTPNQQSFILLVEITYFLILLMPVIIPTYLAADSFVGEKDKGTSVNLVAAPLTDTEIYLGKLLGVAIPTITASLAGDLMFFALTSFYSLQILGFNYVLSFRFFYTILVLAPLMTLAVINLMIWVSTKTNSTRDAQQYGGILTLIAFPFIGTIIAVPLIFGVVAQVIFLTLLLILINYFATIIGLRLFNREKWISMV